MQSKSGFTIVELLIVIVVIGILASITIVAYTGIQDRARFVQQSSNMEQLVRALQLYKADGGSMTDGVAGAGSGNWYGGDDTVYAGTTKSMRQALVDSSYLSDNFSMHFMLAPCNSSLDQSRVVLAEFEPIPEETPQEQIASAGCASGTFTTYTDPDQQYKMNYAKVVY
ncbi:MAG TPA: type II secretion system protein [Candidatus Saccharimonadales bacterium]|nr:type II secretion system protein [Candidatus Saccharimonadales bacterium]